jgi:hypothetical protein
MVFLKKKTKTEDGNVGVQRANTMPSQQPNGRPAQSATQTLQLPKEPDFKPSVVSILDQEWVHQVGFLQYFDCLSNWVAASLDLWSGRT